MKQIVARLGALATVWVGLIAAASGVAHAGTYSTFAAFQANICAEFQLDPLHGPIDLNLPPIVVSGDGYAYTVVGTPFAPMSRDARGVGAAGSTSATRFTFTGRAVTAFAGTFAVVNQADASVAGTVSVTTDTGESFSVATTAAGTFLGFTTTRPFSTVTIDTVPSAAGYELVDNVYVGVSGSAPVGADQCVDAPTVSIGAYAFSTVGGVWDGLPEAPCGHDRFAPSVYFRFVPPASGVCSVDTCGCTYDSLLRAFTGCGGTEIACNDTYCPASWGESVAARIQFRATAVQAVLVRIAGRLGDNGSGVLTIAQHVDCPGDFNHSGTATIQDIFDFLAAWFAGCPGPSHARRRVRLPS